METAESERPIRSESARFRVNGINKGKGVVLLYPDKLASVRVMAEYVGVCLGPLVLTAVYPVSHAIGALTAVFGVMIGSAAGRVADRKIAARAVAGGSQGATFIPLDRVISLRTDRSAWLAGWYVSETLVVTTADGTEYGFRGRTGYLQAGMASVLAGLGREVRATPLGLEVTPRAVGSGA